jgi:hypothetical protein
MLGSQRGTQRAWQDTIDRLKEAGDWEAAAALWDARAENERLKNAIRRLAEQDATLSVCDGAVTVTMDGTLTDAERAATDMATARLSAANAWLQDEIKRLRITDEERTAIEVAAGDYLYHQDPGGRAQHIRQTLLGLLERTK